MAKSRTRNTEIKLYLHRKVDGTETLEKYDRSRNILTNQICPREVAAHGACMGEVVVKCEYQTIEGDPRATLIQGLEAAVAQERADSQVRVNKLLDQISQLKCLTHEPSKR